MLSVDMIVEYPDKLGLKLAKNWFVLGILDTVLAPIRSSSISLNVLSKFISYTSQHFCFQLSIKPSDSISKSFEYACKTSAVVNFISPCRPKLMKMQRIVGYCSGCTNPINKLVNISETRSFSDLYPGICNFYKIRL
mmetsp:Transcript_15366/g.2569  ORF Transcript_15366/g.2569 Transcript_15366/m.2569 type:complete len:137 (-) Transcript_15366:174-584(-)